MAHEDQMRRLMRQDHGITPLTLDLSGHPGMPPVVELSKPVTVIAGLNGAGKSRLLKALRLELGSRARFVPLHALCDWILRDLTDRDDLHGLKDETSPITVSREYRDGLERIIGRNYTDVNWHSIDIADSPFFDVLHDDVVPYFEVKYGDSLYGMADMGLGELSAHVMMWLAWHFSKSDPLIILLDEPDAFLPPVARKALFDLLGSLASQGHAVVTTSHSQEFLTSALRYPGALSVISRMGSQVAAHQGHADVREIVNGILHRSDAVRYLMYVEDEVAYVFASELFRRLSLDLWRCTAIYWVKGTGGVQQLRKILPRPARAVRGLSSLLIVDGDQSVPTTADLEKWPRVRLPGDKDPDDLLSEHCRGEVESLAKSLDKSVAAVAVLLSSIEGRDGHDWTTGFLDGSDVDRQVAIRAIVKALLDGQEGAGLLNQFRKSLLDCSVDGLAHFIV